MPHREDPNADIKRKLIVIPVIAVSAVAAVMGAGSALLMTHYSAKSPDPSLYMALFLFTLGVIVLFSLILIPLIHKRFIDRLDRLQRGLFGFLDYLAGKKEKISYIDENTGDMSDLINTKMREIARGLSQDSAFIDDLMRVVQAVEKGDYSKRITHPPATRQLRDIHTGINQMLASLQKDIGRDLPSITEALKSFSQEDYTSRIMQPSGEVERAVNRLGDVISRMLESDRSIGIEFSEKAKDVDAMISRAYDAIDGRLSEELKTIVESVDEIAGHIKSNVESASFIASYAHSVSESAGEGELLAQQTATSISEIGAEVKQISETIAIIDKITMQTNILSLNAAVEASTAGEAGKGFAVVAQEVRTLAAETAKASKEIHSVVERARSRAESGNEIASRMITGYHHLVGEVSRTTEIIYEITQTSNLQEQQIAKIHDLVTNMLSITDSCLTQMGRAQELAGQNHQRAREIIEMTEAKKFTGADA